MGFAPTITEEHIAAAVQGYCKALRLLGYDGTDIGTIARSLRLEPAQVESAFKNFKITKSKIEEKTKRSIHRTVTEWTPVVTFKRK